VIPLERLLQQEGVGSRRECRRLVEGGSVAVAGRCCTDADARFPADGTRLAVGGRDWVSSALLVVLLNKPVGYECSRQPVHHPSVFALLPPQLARRGVQPVGRLDADTGGLLVLTDDGALNHALASPRRHVAKRYEARLRHAADEAFLERLRSGVVLRDAPQPVAAQAVEWLAPDRLRLTVFAGRYHLVRRLVAAAGNRVEALQRLAIGGLALPADLAPGTWRAASTEEIAALRAGEAPEA
jgi:16S rRNA pseudouridine516 synthase